MRRGGERGAVVGVQHEVVSDGERVDDAVLAPVLGHVPDTVLVHLARAGTGEVDAPDRDAAAGESRIPAMASTSSRCPLPSTPAMPKISPSRTVKFRPDRSKPRSSVTTSSRTSQHAPCPDGPAACRSRSITSRPTMSVASVCCVADVGSAVPTTRPWRSTVMRSATSSTSRQLVGDEHDRLALRDQAAHDAEELLDLPRREHGRRLVEDQDVGFAEQRLQQLDSLLLADRQVLDLGVGVDVEAVALAELQDPPAGGLEIEHRSAAQFVAEHDVLGDREYRDQLEVLVHHSDAARRSRRANC